MGKDMCQGEMKCQFIIGGREGGGSAKWVELTCPGGPPYNEVSANDSPSQRVALERGGDDHETTK